jgi:hypothetical protein
MRPVVDFPQGLDHCFGLNLRGVEPCMAEKLLDQADVRAVLQYKRGAAWRNRLVLDFCTSIKLQLVKSKMFCRNGFSQRAGAI